MATLTRPYNFSAGTFAVAAQVNTDFDAIYNWINGGAAMWADGSVAFSGIPLAPNTDPTNINHLTRKRYVDNGFFAGSPWNGPPPPAPIHAQWQAGQVSGVLDGSGHATIGFPNPFSTTLFGAGAWMDVSAPGSPATGCSCAVFGPLLTSFGVAVTKPNGTPAAGLTGIVIVWMAVGY